MDTMIINKLGPSRESADKHEDDRINYQSNDRIEQANKWDEILLLPTNIHASTSSTGKKTADGASLRIGQTQIEQFMDHNSNSVASGD